MGQSQRMAALPDIVARRAARQHGAVARVQLLGELGCASSTVDGWLHSGLLHPASVDGVRMVGVYTVAGAPDGPLRRVAVAWLRSGAGALIGGPTACALYGLDGFDLAGPVHVLVPPSRRVRGVPLVVRYAAIPNADRARVHGIPTLTPTRSIIDALPHVPASSIRVGLDHGRRHRLLTLERVARRAAALGRAGGAPGMRRLIASGTFQHESEGERALARLFDGPYPKPAYQVWVLPGIRVDALFAEVRLVLEYDGRDHHTIDVDRDADSRRELRLKEHGFEVIRVTAAMLAHDRDVTRARILHVRAQRLAAGVPAWSAA